MKKLLIPTSFLFGTALFSGATTLVEFNFSSLLTNASTESSYTQLSDYSLATTEAANYASQLNTNASLYQTSSQSFPRVDAAGALLVSNSISADYAARISTSTANPYFEFSFTVAGLATGETLTLDSFTYDYGTLSGQSAFTRSVESDLGGSLASFYSASGNSDGAFTANDTLLSTAFSAAERTLENGDTVTFRMQFTNGTSSGSRYHLIDDLTLTGTVNAVPEPSAVALLGLGGLALIARRKR